MFLSKKNTDIEGHHGYRSDNADLIKEWLQNKESLGLTAKYIYEKREMNSLKAKDYDSILGLFAPDHMPYHLEADDNDPSLTEMTLKAIEMLSQKNEGFFLFVEGEFLNMDSFLGIY